MRAAVIHGAEDLRLETHQDPSLGAGQALIRIRAGGICGSDLHYFFEGRNGDFVVKEPLIPGHEVSGEIAELGAGVEGLAVGERVAVHPGRPCLRCYACREGRSNLCRNVFFMGSASRFPHMQGGFCDYVVVEAAQCFKVSPDLAFETAAFAEPLAVCLHAVARAGSVLGKSVLVTGSGPIGHLVMLAARHAGAGRVTMTDVLDGPLRVSRQLGAACAVNVATNPDALADDAATIGGYQVAFEVSGNPKALDTCISQVRVGATVVQVGTIPAGMVPVNANAIMGKEIDLRGAMRFDAEFAHAVRCLNEGLIDVRPLLTATLPFEQVNEAFALAKTRDLHQKVQITL